MEEMNEVQEAIINAVIMELGDEVVDAIRAEERYMILDFLRSEEWMYESCEDAANAIEELYHYGEDSIH